ncbi:MAG TPA: hypothetical protein VLT33_15255 [Labilithrix sp.]|nr:hypothetical protein [Labilithrix sp.]
MLTRFQVTAFALVTASLAGCSSSGTSTKTNDPAGGAGGDPGGAAAVASTRFFLPTGEPTNTAEPTLRIDASDGIHTVYPQFVRGGAFYGYCPASCAKPEDVKVVPFETDGTVHNAMLALDDSGKPRVLLSTMKHVYYATCDAADCSTPAGWTATMILDHGADERDVSGKAFALDRQGRPRFVMHTTKAYLGVGQKTPETYWVSCDAGCSKPESWTKSKIADQIWRSNQLIFDAQGRAHLATVASVAATATESSVEMSAYALCEGSCEKEDSWKTAGLTPAFESTVDVVDIKPAISLALTRAGAPRVIVLGMDAETRKRNLTYFECDADCTGKGWQGSVISTHEKLGPGLDLALDASDHPRFVHTLDYNIALAHCDEASCAAQDAKWDLTKVEYGGEMKPDEIFLYTNCTVGAWFLHSPSLVLTKEGRPRVGYQARDMSGGWKNPTPATTPDCKAGTDMTWSRLAIMPSAH